MQGNLNKCICAVVVLSKRMKYANMPLYNMFKRCMGNSFKRSGLWKQRL